MTELPGDQKQTITLESPYKYFHMMMNMCDDDLDLHQYRLYGHYLRVAGQKGGCDESVRTTASICGMGHTTVIRVRRELVQLGYIKADEPSPEEARKGATVHVTIIDKWAENIRRYNPAGVPVREHLKQNPVPNEEQQPHAVTNQEQQTAVSVPNQEQGRSQPGTGGVPNEERKNNSIKNPPEEPESQERLHAAAAGSPRAREDRDQGPAAPAGTQEILQIKDQVKTDPLWQAYAGVWEVSPDVPDKKALAYLETIFTLRDAHEATPEDVAALTRLKLNERKELEKKGYSNGPYFFEYLAQDFYQLRERQPSRDVPWAKYINGPYADIARGDPRDAPWYKKADETESNPENETAPTEPGQVAAEANSPQLEVV